MDSSGAGEGGPLLGSLRPRSPEKGSGGYALSFSWLGGRGGAATPGAGGERERERGVKSERLIVRELSGRGGWEGIARPSLTLCWFINECIELSGSAAGLLAQEKKIKNTLACTTEAHTNTPVVTSARSFTAARTPL